MDVEPKHFHYDLTEGDAGRVWIHCETVYKGFVRPEDVSSEILKYLLGLVQKQYPEEPIDRCVISVPAYFDDIQREATIAAGPAPRKTHFHHAFRIVQWIGESETHSRARCFGSGLRIGSESRPNRLCV